MKPLSFEGKAWVIPTTDIDTDMIFHNAHLSVTEVSEMGQYAFGNLEGWEEFTSLVKSGDILICGENFGCGSSRQHAVDCFKALGVSVIIAESFGAIYLRNAINSGMPILTFPGITTNANLTSKDTIKVNLETGVIFNSTRHLNVGHANPTSKVQLDIYHAGDLFNFGRTSAS